MEKKLIESPINYMGSKYKLLENLLPLFPTDKNIFIDLFTGGGSIYMNVSDKYNKVIANDLLTDLIEIHKNLADNEFIQKASELSIETKIDKDKYLLLREEYNKEKKPEQLLALIRSCNSNMMRFNNNFLFNQTWGKRSFNKNTQKKIDIYKMQDYSNVTFTSKHFTDIEGYDEDTFVYLDPPYSNTEAGYNAFWNNKDEEDLINLLKYFIDNNIAFGISGVINGKENKIYNFLKEESTLHIFKFGDLYQKISKKEKINTEYYITNYIN